MLFLCFGYVLAMFLAIFLCPRLLSPPPFVIPSVFQAISVPSVKKNRCVSEKKTPSSASSRYPKTKKKEEKQSRQCWSDWARLSHEPRASRPKPRNGPKPKVYIWWLGLGWTGLGLGLARAQGKNVHWHENAANWHHINEFRTEQIHRKSMQNAANGLKINAQKIAYYKQKQKT